MYGYHKMTLTLDTGKEIKEDKNEQLITFDSADRQLIVNALVSQKKAGFKVNFFVNNCLIDDTGLNLLFFYRQPTNNL